MSTFEPLEDRRLLSASLSGTTLTVTGTGGNDTIVIRQENAASIRVEDNGAVISFNDAAVDAIVVSAGAGDDTVQANSTDALPLTERMTIDGGDGADLLVGGHGNDLVLGFAGNDTVRGGAGQDILDAGEGNNSLFGDAGGDALFAGHGSDRVDGGTGIDEVHYDSRTSGVKISLDNVANDGSPPAIVGGGGSFVVIPGEGDNVLDTVERVTTGSGDDVITGGTLAAANRFSGGGGNDRLEGRDGDDSLIGGDGDDVLLGGTGRDSLSGDAGNDTLTGGSGVDSMFGGDGDDSIFSDDSTIDAVLDGGKGFDALRRDVIDPVGVNVESILTV
jgi:Ca2+-binding RTX toxin-like protein